MATLQLQCACYITQLCHCRRQIQQPCHNSCHFTLQRVLSIPADPNSQPSELALVPAPPLTDGWLDNAVKSAVGSVTWQDTWCIINGIRCAWGIMVACPTMLVMTWRARVCVCVCVCMCAHIQAVANSEIGGGESSSHCLFCHDTGKLVSVLPSINQHLMHYLSYTSHHTVWLTLWHISALAGGAIFREWERQCWRVIVLVTQRELVCERQSIKSWFKKVKINMNIMQGM
jgi:hypothetical protein